MARISSEAFAVFNSFEVIHLAGSCSSLGIDAPPQGDLCIDAAVVAMGLDRLRDQQNRDAEEAESADGRQYGVGTISRAVSCCWLWSTMRRLSLVPAYGQPYALIGLEQCGDQPKPRPEALEGSPAIRNSM